MDTLVVNTSWLQSLTCMQVHLCMAQGGSAHEWFSVGREHCHPLQGTSGNVWRHVMTAGEAASGIPWLEVIDTPKVLLCRGDLLHRPTCLTQQETPAPKWQSHYCWTLLVWWFWVQCCVCINVPCEHSCIIENCLLTQAAPAVSLTQCFQLHSLTCLLMEWVTGGWIAVHSHVFPWVRMRVLPLIDSFFNSGVKISLIIRTLLWTSLLNWHSKMVYTCTVLLRVLIIKVIYHNYGKLGLCRKIEKKILPIMPPTSQRICH